MLAAVAMWAAPSSVIGQTYQTNDRAYHAGDSGMAVPASAEDQAASDLTARVAELEKAVKKASDKEAADKKKAAGKPSVMVSGMIQTDVNMFSQDANSKVQFPKGGTGADGTRNGVEFRRARIKVSGEAFDVTDYSIEVDFATSTTTSSAAIKDTYIGMKELPLVGNFRIGHFKEPFGLDQITSDRFVTFLERSVSDEGAIVPGRNWGFDFFNWSENERITGAIGMFATNMPDNQPKFQENDGGWATTMRMTFLPWYDEASQGRGLLHFGAAYSYRDVGYVAGVPNLSISAKPEAHLGPTVVTLAGAGALPPVNSEQLFGAEAAMVYGPLSFQSEYFMDVLDITGTGKVQVNGCYAYVSYFLTGENRGYNRRQGCFDRVKPFENFFRVRTGDGNIATGLGAWEIAYRYSMLDLNPVNVADGAVFDHTIGLNWYWNPYTRVMFNYVNSHVVREKAGLSESNMDIYEARFAIDF